MSSEDRRPSRPAIPPTLYALVCVWATERALMSEGTVPLEGAACKLSLLCAGTLLLGALVAYLRAHPLWPSLVMLACCVLAALVVSSCTLLAGTAFSETAQRVPVSTWRLRVVSDPSKTDFGYRCRAHASADGMPEGDVWLSLQEAPSLRDELCCVGRFVPLGESEYDISARMQGVWGTIRVARIKERRSPSGLMGLVQDLRAYVVDRISPGISEERALLAGCVCGSREKLRDYGLDKLFASCGMAHLVAVSGGHLTILASLVSLLLDRFMLKPRVRVVVLGLVSGLFVLICGAPVSAVRSWLMTMAGLAGGMLGRRSHALSALCAIALGMALVDPSVSGQLGYLLSVLSVGGLCILGTYAAYVLHVLVGRPASRLPLPHKLRRRLSLTLSKACTALGVTLVAQVTTLPLAAQSFGEVSLVAPLAGLITSTPFTAFVSLGLVASALSGVPQISTALLCACDLLAHLILAVLRWLSGWPYAKLTLEGSSTLSLVVLALFVGLLLWWPKVSRGAVLKATGAAALLCTVFLLRWRYLAPACVRVLDVGQGDAILVQDHGSAILVDTGPDDSVRAALARAHVLHLDAVVITHLHDDHYGGLPELVGSIPCERVLVAKGVADQVEGELAQAVQRIAGQGPEELSYGDSLQVGDFHLEMVWPTVPVSGNENAHSIELLLSYEHDGRRLCGLLTGDAERDELGQIIAAGDVGDIDLLKVGHHGSEVSLTAEEARVLDAEVAVASAGVDNDYGHPAPECVRILERSGSEFFCTKDCGDVEIRPGAQGPEVITQR
ncbi:MAG: ComEC/Rec2 family competence protein [Coriobacteriales bacterium]|nr:ComEC/Rec2 family competence protein [Coriobacteriales bacterium]